MFILSCRCNGDKPRQMRMTLCINIENKHIPFLCKDAFLVTQFVVEHMSGTLVYCILTACNVFSALASCEVSSLEFRFQIVTDIFEIFDISSMLARSRRVLVDCESRVRYTFL
jgi:hypothetical protein